MKKCELCNKVASMYCSSDQASLCWDCDSTIHTANFLVAKHTRTLLCHACQSPTSWTGSGPKLSPTVSACENCVNGNRGAEGEDDDEEIDGDSEDEEDVHVVPLSPPPVSSFDASASSGSEGSSSCRRDGFSGFNFPVC